MTAPDMATTWPEGEDGDVMRRLQEIGFAFSAKAIIDFNVDFEAWPPPREAIAMMEHEFPTTWVCEPWDGSPAFLQFQLYEVLTYELAIGVQHAVTSWMAPYGGVCDSWAVQHPPVFD